MRITSLEDVKLAFQISPYRYVGVGITAFMRIIPAFFIENYEIIAFRCSKDLEDVMRYAPVVCLEHAIETPETEDVNAYSILRLKEVQRLLAEKGGKTGIILYQSYPELEKLADLKGWRIIGSPASVRSYIENKKNFRKILSSLGLPVIPGEVLRIAELDKGTYDRMAGKYGPGLVLQLPEITRGGGRGTFFVDSHQDFERIREIISTGTHRGYRLETLIITQRRLGLPASVAACITRHGTLVSSLQTQLLDITDVLTPTVGNGFFCGHDWNGADYSHEINQRARDITERLGEHFRSLGYRGIFGVDFIVEQDGRIFPVECNARYTGAFPMLSLLYLKEGLIPMDAFHIMELSGMDYQIDVAELNASYQKSIRGSHIILFNRYNLPGKISGDLRSGRYSFHHETGRIRFCGAGMGYQDLRTDTDFILTDGVPASGSLLYCRDELERICRVLFSSPISETPTRLKKSSRAVIRWIYDQLHFRGREEMPAGPNQYHG